MTAAKLRCIKLCAVVICLECSGKLY